MISVETKILETLSNISLLLLHGITWNVKHLKIKNIIIHIYSLNSFANPYNSPKSNSPFMLNKGVIFQPSTLAQYFMNLDQNIINTDRSLLPYKSLQKQISIEMNNTVEAYFIANDYPTT